MRDAFASAITDLASKSKDIVLLSGDIGNRMFDNFKEIAPDRFYNCGIAEQNMISVAAGMALSGLRPVVYTIAPFITTRCFEQIRIGLAYHRAPVVLIGTGSGLSYAELGATHHSCEDIAIMRTLPGMNIMAPSDSIELVAQLKEAVENNAPTYIRIGKKGEPNIYQSSQGLGIGKSTMVRKGSKLLIIGVGPIISEVLKAADMLLERGHCIAVASLGSVKPLDECFLREVSAGFKEWICVEEHGVVGGAGTTLLEWLAENRITDVALERIGVGDVFIHKLGNQEYTRKVLGLDSTSIAEKALSKIEEKC